MRFACVILAAALLSMGAIPVARADDTAPPAVQPTSPPVMSEPTQPPAVEPPAPVADTPVPAPQTNPVPQTNPIPQTNPAPDNGSSQVSKESRPVYGVHEPNSATPPTPVAPVQSGAYDVPNPHPFTIPGTDAGTARAPTTGQASRSQSGASTLGASSGPAASANPGAPGVPPIPDTGVTLPVIDPSAGTTSAPAPSQLVCRGSPQGTAAPFLVSPYNGWTEINSFVDHDSPDYTVDGTIVIANGLTATAGDGEASDYFASYWSSSLRQYISYDGHNGYDFGISYQPVLAAGDGTVEFADWNGSSEYAGYGLMVLIDHHNGYVTLYGHLSKLEVKKGDKVTAGQEIGISGNTGHSSGPHLHFSVFHNCQVTDPYGWTGHGKDPLEDFDGEHASYLWLPGHDPLVINPPPAWPVFPLGLKVPILRIIHARLAHIIHNGHVRSHPSGALPPVERLLLLKVAAPDQNAPVSAPIALARTEALITQEGESLAPYLDDLRSLGLLDAYQVIPAAAAVWIRGTASSAQLEGLPGVASLAGVRPRDLQAAQVGLSHSVLMQIGHQQAPSLWPVGFRSALHAWRPLTTVADGHALVTGIALPGQRVVLSLHRRSSIPGVAEARTDPETGAFVAMLHDRLGTPAIVRSGDMLQLDTGGRRAQLQVVPVSLQARARHITGQAPPGATVLIGVIDPTTGNLQTSVLTAGPRGAFQLPVHGPLPAGTLAVASVVDTAGNQESATDFVPGVVVGEGSSIVHGWTAGSSPRLRIFRRGKMISTRHIKPAPDGTFQLDLSRGKHHVAVRAGDLVWIGTRWHQRSFTLPRLSLTLPLGSNRMSVAGPAHARVLITSTHAAEQERTQTVHLDASGAASIAWPAGTMATGDAATIQLEQPNGDTIATTRQVRGIVVRQGSPRITGQVRPGTTISIHLTRSSDTWIGSAITASDPDSGRFSATLRDTFGRPVPLAAGMHVEVHDGVTATTFTVPQLTLEKGRLPGTDSSDHSTVLLAAAPSTGHPTVLLTIADTSGQKHTQPLTPDGHGHLTTRIADPDTLKTARTATLTAILSTGVDVERTLSLITPKRAVKTARLSPHRKFAHTGH